VVNVRTVVFNGGDEGEVRGGGFYFG